MKRSIRSLAASAALAGVFLLVTSGIALGQAVISTSGVNFIAGGAAVLGASSTLVRDTSGITASLNTSQLEPGTAYTLWIVVFNEPENCVGPCDVGDVAPFPGNSAAGVSLVFGGGYITGSVNRSSFAGRLNVGDTSSAMFGPGLVDPIGAEVHLVVRSHGEPLPGMIEQQTGSFNGGCPPNTCISEQISMHRPDVADNSLVRLSAIQAELEVLERKVDRIGLRLGIFVPE